MRVLAWLVLLSPTAAGAAEAVVAVAANFRPVAELLARDFAAGTPHSVRITSGSTGKLYAQVVNGAPFDVFLSADEDTAARLETSALGVPGSRFSYAYGRLVLWAREPALLRHDLAATLQQPGIHRLAIANPALAPYGKAAEETLAGCAGPAGFAGLVVTGENVAQAFAFVATGNADAGLVALSSVLDGRAEHGGAWLEVPSGCHARIRQDAVLLRRGADNAAAVAFLEYLSGDAARARIAERGYGV